MANNESTPKSIRTGMLFCERYRIERKIDDGGMASVYLAVDESSGLPVAIKVLFVRYSDNSVIRARFLDEGRIQAMLEHPNIIHVYRIIEEPILSFVMEYIEGESLEEYLHQHKPIDETEIVDLMMPVMSAIGFAHSKGIVHRDLKPSNILLKKNAGYLEPKVMDFGVAKISRGKELTAAGTTVGTLHYMSPEQIVGARDIDGRADIYSLGCSIYKLCTGEVPFNASSEFALMMAQVEAPPTPPREIRPDLSENMEQLILRALAKEPANRFQTIKEMTSALMKVGKSGTQRDTVTRPIPGDLLQFAMDADEVAMDQSQDFRLYKPSDHVDSQTETLEELDLISDDASGKTHELSRSAIFEIERDRIKAEERQYGETAKLSATDRKANDPLGTADKDARKTVDEDELETLERDAAKRNQLDVDDSGDEDSKVGTDDDLETARTRERDAVDRHDVDTRERTLNELTTRPTAGLELDPGLDTTTERRPPELDRQKLEATQKTPPPKHFFSPDDEEEPQSPEDLDATVEIGRSIIIADEDESELDDRATVDALPDTSELSELKRIRSQSKDGDGSKADDGKRPGDIPDEDLPETTERPQKPELSKLREIERNSPAIELPKVDSQEVTRQKDRYPPIQESGVDSQEVTREKERPSSIRESGVDSQEVTRRKERPPRPSQYSNLHAPQPPRKRQGSKSNSEAGSSSGGPGESKTKNSRPERPSRGSKRVEKQDPKAIDRGATAVERPSGRSSQSKPNELPPEPCNKAANQGSKSRPGHSPSSGTPSHPGNPSLPPRRVSDQSTTEGGNDDEPQTRFPRGKTASHELEDEASPEYKWIMGGLAVLIIALVIFIAVVVFL